MKLSELHVIDLFSGIGGFSLGLHQADSRFKTIAFCEIDPFCQKVLKKNFPEVKIYGDIKKTTFTEPAFLVCGGFPCQSISIAGKQRGKDDDRWLFPQMLRVIKEVKPKWIIAENVQNLLNIADGEILQGIYNDLESLDYEVQTFRISAASQGAWHKRERVWIVAHTDSTSNGKNDVPDSSIKRLQGYRFSSNLENEKHKTQKFTKRDIKEQQNWWQTVAKICGVPNGVQYGLDKDQSKRIKALGNAIVPQIITELGKAIIKAEFNDG